MTEPRLSLPEQFRRDRRIGWVWLVIAVFMISSAYASARAFIQPVRNWDMMAYIGAVIAWDEKDYVEVHRRMLEEVRPVLWDSYYKDVSEKNPLSSTAEGFRDQMPFYHIKPLYIAMVWMVEKLHIAGYAAATWSVASACFLLFALLAIRWHGTGHLSRSLFLIGLLAMTWLGPLSMQYLPRASTPDSMALLLMFGAVFAAVQSKSSARFFILSILAIAARPDALVFLGMMTGVLWLAGEGKAKLSFDRMLLFGIGMAAFYFTVQQLVGGYSWTQMFYFGFISHTADIATVPIDLTFEKYWGTVEYGASKLLGNDARLLPLLVLSAIAIPCYWLRPKAPRIMPLLLALAWGHFIVRFLLYPAWGDPRYYYMNYVLALLASCEMIAPCIMVYWDRILKHRAELNS